MWYKEWLVVRYKATLAVVIYTLVALLSLANWSSSSVTSLFGAWIPFSLVATLGLGALGGIDLLSDEKDKGTISFLLTRPVSRTRIYGAKILANTGPLALIYSVFTLIMLGLARLPIKHDSWDYEMQRVVYNNVPARVTAFTESLALALVVILAGLAVICLTGFISIFARSVVETIIGTVLVVVVVVTVGALIGAFGTSMLHLELNDVLAPLTWIPGLLGPALSITLVFGGPLALLSATLYAGGQRVFQHKEF